MDYEIIDAIYGVPQHEIVVDPGFNCRGAFTVQSVEGLAKSIEENGLLEPVIIQPLGDVGDGALTPYEAKYRIVAGHRREAAIRWFLKWDKIPSRIVKGLDQDQAQVLNFIENLDREDLTMLEEAEALDRVWPHVSERQLALRLKRDPRWIRARRRLLTMPDDIRQAAASGRITQYDVEFIGRAKDQEEQRRLYEKVLDAKQNPDKKVRYRGQLHGRRQPRSKSQINIMVSHLMQHAPHDADRLMSALVWAAGHIETQEFLEDRLGLPFDKDMFND